MSKAVVLFWCLLVVSSGQQSSDPILVETSPGNCFCQLRGKIDDCTCSVDTVDYFNNINIYPRMKSLTHTDYFRYYKANMKRECPFWADDSKCSIKDCHVLACSHDKIPAGLRSDPAAKYLESSQGVTDCDDDLGYLDKTLSSATKTNLDTWSAFDEESLTYCDVGDQSEDSAEFVDLMINPERFTGYRGPSAHRIWRSIYDENCFKPDQPVSNPFEALKGMCLEKRAFYRAVSGLHTSINIHLCANFLLSDKITPFATQTSLWGPNLEEFRIRFDPELTDGFGPQRLRNLYFVYLLEMRALAKASPYLQQLQYYTGNEEEDGRTQHAVEDLLSMVNSFPEHFNEKYMFSSGESSTKLKEEFRLHFLNITRIMDCVGCDKCKLWGKLQIQGLGTALKILFTPEEDIVPIKTQDVRRIPKFRLRRNEIVALVNAFARLSSSIRHIEEFRIMLR